MSQAITITSEELRERVERPTLFEQYHRLIVRQIQFFHRHQNILAHNILISMGKNFLWRTLNEPLAIFVLLTLHLLIERSIQFLVVHFHHLPNFNSQLIRKQLCMVGEEIPLRKFIQAL